MQANLVQLMQRMGSWGDLRLDFVMNTGKRARSLAYLLFFVFFFPYPLVHDDIYLPLTIQ